MDCSLPRSSVHGDSPGRKLEWVAIPFSRDLSNPGIESVYPALLSRFFTAEAPRKPLQMGTEYKKMNHILL